MMTNRRNFLWSLLVIGTGIALLLLAVDVFPENVRDLMERSWAILLVIAGTNMLLIDRVRFGNWIALILSVVILGTIIFFAFEEQASKLRTEYVEAIEPVILGENIQAVNVSVEMIDATVIFRPIEDGSRGLKASFVGSAESEVSISVQENDNGIVDFTVTEKRLNSIPNLEAIGRGELEVFLPVGVTVANLNFENQEGLATLDLRVIDIPRFKIDNQSGDIDLYMPIRGVAIGDVAIHSGNLRLLTSPDNTLRISNAPSNTELNTNDYQLLVDGSLESRGGLVEFQFNLRVDLPSGTLTIQPPQEG